MAIDKSVSRLDAVPIFVLGIPRSGTTLTARILGRHQKIFALAPGETHYFHDVWSRRRELGDLQDDKSLSQAADRLLTVFARRKNLQAQAYVNATITTQDLLQYARELGGGYGGLYYAFTQMLARGSDKQYYCDDTPKHLFHLHDIFELFPKAKVIACVRDPRDFLCSYKHYWKKADDPERIQALYHPIITSLLWRGSTNLLLKHIEQCCHDRVLLVRYETLVRYPKEEVRRICDFLDFQYTDDLIQVEGHNSSFETDSSGIFATSVGRWRTCLEPEEVWWVQALNRGNMQALNYNVGPVRPSMISLVSTLLGTPVSLAKALKANSPQTGPLLEYVTRRLASFFQ